ncbi:MAG TPA: hypothetical protein VFE24_10960 [Pirellulales bacterium]|jgi:ElaB/YqjD/DUF883 family membrane-anchored ribosome-binding protein|nr:hypothetical protein [Pirellulales bacterium]
MYDTDNETIKRQMAHTRASLAEKLETLETRVTDTVQHANDAIGGTVEKATSCVNSAVDTVKAAVSATEQTVHTTVETVRENLSLAHQVDRHPWLMVGGAVGLGYCLDRFFEAPRRARSADADHAASSNGHGSNGHGSNSSLRLASATDHGTASASGESAHEASPAAAGSQEKSTLASSRDWLTRVLGPHAQHLQQMAVGTLMSTVRNVVSKSLDPQWGGPVADAIDDLTRELGGVPAPRPTAQNH